MVLLATLAMMFACAEGTGELGEAPGPGPDAAAGADSSSVSDQDGDGFAAPSDCNDQNPAVHPNAAELCDGVDNNCSGTVDDDPVDAVSYYADGDGDGFGDPDSEVLSCTAQQGMVDNGLDCYDNNAQARPGQTAFFTVDRGDGSFDYDCTGANESSVPLGNCSFNGSDCGFAPGWDGGAPACGASGTTISGCLTVCIGICICDASTSTDTNECR